MITAVKFLERFVNVKPKEIMALLVSCSYFYLILCAYYIVRPIRSEMVIANGVENVQWLMLMTVIVLLCITPVFGWVTTRFKTRQFLSYCTLFFASHLVVFYFLFDVEQRSPIVTRAFFVWVNVFNMFIVSLFWSFMNDVFSRAQSKRLFAFIAAGGTAGAISGPILTSTLVEKIGLAPLLLISACVLAASVACALWLIRWPNEEFSSDDSIHTVRNESLKGGIWGAFKLILKSPYLAGICLFIALYAVSITWVEIQQATLIQKTFTDPTERTKLFSIVDLSVNILALLIQLLFTAHLIRRIGFRASLMLVPIGITVGFALMGALPVLAVMVGVEIFRRAGDYSIMKPTREMLFSVVSREEKYKAKNFIDTTILRGGNTSSAMAYTGIKALGVSTAGITGITILLGIAWCSTAYWLGGQFEKKRDDKRPAAKPDNSK